MTPNVRWKGIVMEKLEEFSIDDLIALEEKLGEAEEFGMEEIVHDALQYRRTIRDIYLFAAENGIGQQPQV